MSLHEIVGCGARPYPPSGLESDNCTIWFMSDHNAADPKETTQVVHLVVFCGVRVPRKREKKSERERELIILITE